MLYALRIVILTVFAALCALAIIVSWKAVLAVVGLIGGIVAVAWAFAGDDI